MKNQSTLTPPTGWYQHYKGQYYEVIGVATHSEDESKLVVYRPGYGEQDLWVRPLSMFTETVSVDGGYVPRFRFVGKDKPSGLSLSGS